MKLQRSTLILVTSAVLLGAVVLFLEGRQANRPGVVQGDSEAAPVYAFDEADVTELHIETTNQTVTFKRDEAGLWQMTEPENAPAEAAAIAFLLSRLTSDGLLRTTTIDAANQAEFGLDVPFAVVEITLQDGTAHTLVLGDADFSGQNAYALIDPEKTPLAKDAGEVTVALVSDDIVSGVDRPLDEWQATVEAEDGAEPESATPSLDDDGASPEPGTEGPPEEAAPSADVPEAEGAPPDTGSEPTTPAPEPGLPSNPDTPESQ